MISSAATAIKNRLMEFCTIVCFTYQGVDCDIDPFNPSLFHMRYGDQECDVDSIDKVMKSPFFAGKSLESIASQIQDLEL